MHAVDVAAPEPLDVLVGRAATAVSRAALGLLGGGYGRRVLVVAGPGNNGQDGRVAAELLRRRGVRVRVFDAADAPAVLPAADLVVDAAFGTGFRGSYEFPEVGGTPVLAVDICSGLSGLTGEAAGSPPLAVATVTFAALKPGLLLAEGPGHGGEVIVADIGLDVGGARTHLVTDADVAAWTPRRAPDAHKWRHAVWLIAGSAGMSGAAQLAATAALRGGAGYVRLSSPGVADPAAPIEAVVHTLPDTGWAADALADAGRFAAVAVGPGLGRASGTAAELDRLARALDRPLVLDGDALSLLGTRAGGVLRGRSAPTVLTPHDGEYERLVGHPPGADRLAATRDLARDTGAVVLLKGPTTVVAAPDGACLLVRSGDARLATAGTGDVLTGLAAALLASGVPPLRAAAAAAHLHGRAATLGPERGLIASDLPERLSAAWRSCCGEDA